MRAATISPSVSTRTSAPLRIRAKIANRAPSTAPTRIGRSIELQQPPRLPRGSALPEVIAALARPGSHRDPSLRYSAPAAFPPSGCGLDQGARPRARTAHAHDPPGGRCRRSSRSADPGSPVPSTLDTHAHSPWARSPELSGAIVPRSPSWRAGMPPRTAPVSRRRPSMLSSAFPCHLSCCCLTDHASVAASGPLGQYPTFLTYEARASCMRLLGCAELLFRSLPTHKQREGQCAKRHKVQTRSNCVGVLPLAPQRLPVVGQNRPVPGLLVGGVRKKKEDHQAQRDAERSRHCQVKLRGPGTHQERNYPSRDERTHDRNTEQGPPTRDRSAEPLNSPGGPGTSCSGA